MTVQWVTRKDLGWPALSKNTNTDLGMIAHYDGSKGLLAAWRRDGHGACIAYWRRTRNSHINGNGWNDVGYAYFVCPDRKVFEGRGVDRVQAAELPTVGKLRNGNSRYVAVTFGTGPGEMPEPGQVQAWHDLREWLIDNHSLKADIYGHRDFTFTDCPHEVIYAGKKTFLKIRPGSVPTVPLPEVDDLVTTLPTLRQGMQSFDVLTLRSLLFQRFLSERFDPDVTPEDESHTLLFGWLRNTTFTPDLAENVKEYQKWRFPDTPAEWDGIVGPKTWGQLWRTDTER